MHPFQFGSLDTDFWNLKPLIGMVHLPPLPGSAQFDSSEMSMKFILEKAAADARSLEDGGANAIMIENFYDAPFERDLLPPHTISALSLAVSHIRSITQLPLGVNALRNDFRSAIAIAHICGAQFVRINVYVGAAVTDQGLIQGASREAVLYRKMLGGNVAIMADVFVKHATQLGSGTIQDAAKDAVERGLADALIVSGEATGSETSLSDLAAVKASVSQTPVLVGSGFRLSNASEILQIADGAIVGTSLKVDLDGTRPWLNPIDVNKVRKLRAAMNMK